MVWSLGGATVIQESSEWKEELTLGEELKLLIGRLV